MGKRLTQGISLFLTREMSEELHKVSEEKEISISQLLRSLVKEFLLSERNRENNHEGGMVK